MNLTLVRLLITEGYRISGDIPSVDFFFFILVSIVSSILSYFCYSLDIWGSKVFSLLLKVPSLETRIILIWIRILNSVSKLENDRNSVSLNKESKLYFLP